MTDRRPRDATRVRAAALGLVCIAAALVGGCRPANPGDSAGSDRVSHDPDIAPPSVRLTDAAGRPLVLARPAERIVSLVPSVTHVLVALSAADRLVGRTDFDTISDVSGRPSVGGGLGPDLESLLLLEPDLVIRFAGDSDATTPARLDELGIAHLAVRPSRLADLDSIIAWMGQVTGEGPRADRLRADIDHALAAVREAVSGEPRVRVAYLMGGTPPWTAGPGTYIDELVEIAGGVNAFGDLAQLYGPVSPEAIATRPIDVLLISRRTELDPRVRAGRRVYELQTDLEMPGPQVIDALLDLVRGLHPDLDVGSVARAPGSTP